MPPPHLRGQRPGQLSPCGSFSCWPNALPALSHQAIQSRDRIQLQYSQSLIEKDQYRKQVRGLEAERDELLTALTSLEGAKALLEVQLQRVQGGPYLKVSRVRNPSWSSWPGWDLSRGWGHGGPSGSPQLGLGRCRFWEEIRGSWLEPSPKVKNMPVLEGPVGQGRQNVARVVVGWCIREQDRSMGVSEFLGLQLGHKE